MFFQVYSWVGLRPEKYKNAGGIEYDDSVQQVYFVREVLADDTYICDVYDGENHITSHYKAYLPQTEYEKKSVRALFRVTEYFPDRPQFNERTETFLAVEDIVTEAPHWMISKIIILCDSDCKALGIDPAAPWPPTRPA